MKKIIFVAALAGMLIPTIAFAELSYNSVTFDYAKTSQSGLPDLKEFDYGVSKSLYNNLYIAGTYVRGWDQISGATFLKNTYSLNLGWHTPIKENIDFLLFGGPYIERYGFVGGSSTRYNGYQLGVGVRAELSPQLEGLISGLHTSTSANSMTGTSNGINFELGYNMTREFQLFGGYGSISYSPPTGASYTNTTLAIGIRYFY